jgi:hypothetical protein
VQNAEFSFAFDFLFRWDESFATEINLHQPQMVSNTADGGNMVTIVA